MGSKKAVKNSSSSNNKKSVKVKASNKKFKGGKNKRRETVPKLIKPKIKDVEESEESDYGEDMLDMVEEEDLAFLKTAIANKSYSLLKNVKFDKSKGQKRKLQDEEEDDDGDDLENDYESQLKPTKVVKNLLPIKTNKGIVKRSVEQDEVDEPEEEEEEQMEESYIDDENEDTGDDDDDEGMYVFNEDGIDKSVPVSAAQMLSNRNETLRQKKIYIGNLSSIILENPEENILNLRLLMKILDDDTPEVYVTVRKLAIVALLEVFKDILPNYNLKLQDITETKVKKDTLKQHKFEETLLSSYKKYLQHLEKFMYILHRKRGDARVFSEGEINVAEVAVHAMCDLLVSHPYFNFAQNIVQTIVPFLNNPNKNVRQLVAAACKTVFKEDKREEITLKVMRAVNQYLRNHAHNVNADMLEVFLALRIKDVNLDQEKEHDIKEKKLNSKKGNILRLSKRERKKGKMLKELEKEMLETKAEESKQMKHHNLTEITKILFGIYFRILKSSNNTKVLGACLEGLAKFAHCINLEFYVDIVNVLDKLLKEDWLGYRENLNCVRTVFSILGGQGEILNMDPTRFYKYFYQDLLCTTAGRTHNNMEIVFSALAEALLNRRKKITNKRLIGFVKRVTTLALQLLHNGSIGALSFVKTAFQLNSATDILLDLDNSVGDGKFDPHLEEPEYSGAANTALYELTLLAKHYHPIVAKYAVHIANGANSAKEGATLPMEYAKCTMEELFEKFDMSEMAFNPPIRVPKQVQAKARPERHEFANEDFKRMCYKKLKYEKSNEAFFIGIK
ncbi:PREDICTED: nucleolar complex protein 3 homolog [Nicrophorus vespilloides]|uniref:NOC3-like protein n=1 Tax=Nicrophorus vespilloides TaxID=110193 RepID=A0ABM1N5X3_NICVS|nr:PREDICTED: nucleolar complex protein 3 homolog [Nicrophorus vespilloides]